ncbi:Helicase conserved C-terminal domain-containing protein [Actinopolyspora lacussalsi subsp. righensis]|uniref:Helicase conserved C-terminal domain-containing protein n=1 Tax=Actinopolyspora righensis TaxID=995060 RepID=A0A1I7CFD6_9ACTN|nr:DISARM system helicase DrmA [Actinopolyspora righensis]SFT98165.1 Helicase conserved C-terminal domain-containing protein [Actinopolyspora righensis]
MTNPDSSDGLFMNPNGEQGSLDMPTGTARGSGGNGGNGGTGTGETGAGGEDADARPDPTRLLDTEQRFPETSGAEVRDGLQELIVRDLLGPWDGEAEQLPYGSSGPRERYLVGMLGPKQDARPTADAEPAPDTGAETGGEANGEGGGAPPEVLSPQSLGRIWASSMGLSCTVARDTTALHVTAEWGRYAKEDTETAEGAKRKLWTREPVTVSREVRLDGTGSHRLPLTADTAEEPGVLLAVTARDRDGKRVVELTLVNAQREGTPQEESWMFQTRLRATALDGASPVFLPADDPLYDSAAEDDPEEQHLRLLYRGQLRYASGHNVAVHPHTNPGARRAHQLETTWLPTYEVPATVAPGNREGSPLAGTELAMDTLATAEPSELRTGLAPLSEGYRRWLDQRESEARELPDSLRETAESAVFQARRAADRVRAGIDLLTDPDHPGHADALAAFRFANRAMAAQRRHTDLARLRETTEIGYIEAKQRVEANGAAGASWRPFQLAFVLLNLPSLVDPDHAERAADSNAVLDLLFFPTGGGKTEAYLGLTAFTFAIRRLQGTFGSGEDARDGGAGVAVLMRYTLRLLTAQQFQRAAALVCAAEMIRREDEATWGGEPFRIGLWVGGSVSPNWFGQAEQQIRDAREAGDGKRANVLQTLACPWCGSALLAHRDAEVDTATRRVLLHCPNAEGSDACPFSKPHSPEGLPILTVDEEIYRLLPSLVIATVDKLAQLPWKGYAGMLFGRVRRWCPRHGYRHDDLDAETGCADKHQQKSGHPGVSSKPVARLRAPDLIIQDELHLISGALGTTVGLFESAVDELCCWRTPGGNEAGPKIIASTATTKRSGEQVRGVFNRDLAVFPPQVTEVSDTFFSHQVSTADKPGRRYLGICAHGVRLKSAEIRVAEILLLGGQTLFDQHGAAADPYMTLVGYFNATRELAGMRRSLDDDVATRVRTHGRRRGISDRLPSRAAMLNIQELTSRISSADISEVLTHLENGFDAEIDTTTRRHAIRANLREIYEQRRKSSRGKDTPEPHPLSARREQRRKDGRDPVDVVLATSMLQVGVDVSRFGLMMVTGQPKNTAEYIQASSRVGRTDSGPGLVVTLYNWTRPRDLAHYEDFEHYHATFYRQVEALSVTPYTRRALDRGVTAAFVAAVRNAAEPHSGENDAQEVALDSPLVERITERMLDRAEAVRGQRGRDYLAERLGRTKDLWSGEQDGEHSVGYVGRSAGRGEQPRRALLTKPGDHAWRDSTVAQSMRETENEINLLVPGGEELFQTLYNAPAWTFAPAPDGEPDAEDEEIPEGDELGDTALPTTKRKP